MKVSMKLKFALAKLTDGWMDAIKPPLMLSLS